MTALPVDRAAAVRGALRTLVARNGFHTASSRPPERGPLPGL